MNKLVAVIAVVVVLGGGWYLYKQGADVNEDALELNDVSQEPVTVVPDTSATGTSTATSTPSIKEFTVTGSNFLFAPKSMTVKKGDTVKITFVNSSGLHDLVIDEFNAKTKQLQAGQSETITFVADKTGSFEYYCSVGEHRQMGMKGMLIVE